MAAIVWDTCHWAHWAVIWARHCDGASTVIIIITIPCAKVEGDHSDGHILWLWGVLSLWGLLPGEEDGGGVLFWAAGVIGVELPIHAVFGVVVGGVVINIIIVHIVFVIKICHVQLVWVLLSWGVM